MGASLSERYVSQQKGTAKVMADYEKLRKDFMKVRYKAKSRSHICFCSCPDGTCVNFYEDHNIHLVIIHVYAVLELGEWSFVASVKKSAISPDL